MKIFLSSTILDLRDLRDTLVKELSADGHEVIASEKGTVLVNQGKHSYEQCLAAVVNCDCLIAVIDGRFGGEYPPGSNKSITEAEIEVALERGKQTLIFVRQSVWDCKATQNAIGKGKREIPYEVVKNIVEDVKVFDLIDRIRKKPKDNWIFQFNFPTDLLSQIRAQIGVSGTVINWLDRSHQLLAAQKHLTTNGLFNNSDRNHNLDDIHVPLGLIERKERPKVKEEPSPEQGSQLYQTEYTETKRFEHQAFLAEVVGNRVAGKHIAIIGEPGAGKTTILTKIGEYLIQQAEQQSESPLVVAWISLESLDKQELSEYLYIAWLKSAHPAACPPPSWKDELVQLVEQRRVWLLLDGLDEISHANAPNWLKGQLEGWGQNLRVVMTCRINQWEAAAGGNILTNSFDVYRTLDYSYQTSQGEDQVEKFISNWFGDKEKEVAHQIRRELDAAGKKRIKDLVKNPLRLTLLCAAWEQDNQALPETQAELYRGFVNYLYGWKAREFKEEVKLKDELNLALGELAKVGLNRASINDGVVRRFRFTASEIGKLWQDLPDTFLSAADKLGWLTVVEKDPINPMYAFYHPTFQEYFAACSIDDWDYFLPRGHVDRPVPCKDESLPTYRVFEKQWQQVIIFWIGRNFENELKNEFLVKLTNFRDETSEFYYYQAYCMAAICVGQFQSSQHAESIVQTVVSWAFGYFDPVQQEWVNLERVNSAFVSSILPLTQRKYLIASLLSHVFQDDLPYEATLLMDSIHTRLHAISVLGKIAKGNKKAIEDLTSFIYKTDSYLLSITAAEALGTIDIGNRLAITVMIEFLCKPSSTKYNVIFFATQCLARISIGNESVIQELLNILSQLRNTDDCRQSMIVHTLSTIAIGHIETLAVLISMLQSSPDFPLSSELAEALVQIASNNEDAIEMINSNFSVTTQNKDIEPYISRILLEINGNNRKEAVSLYNLFLDSKIDFFHVKEVLESIEIGDKQLIKELSDIILEMNIDNPKIFLAAHTLSRIDVGNKLAITTLLTIISQSNLDDYSLLEIVHSLQKIALGNREVIERLMDFLSKPNLSDILRYSIAYTLWNIDISNNKAITTLLDLISQPEWDNSLPMGTGEGMNEIITINLMPMVVSKLKYQVQTDMCESNDKKFYICQTVMWKCAQSLSYHEFHSAWHQN